MKWSVGASLLCRRSAASRGGLRGLLARTQRRYRHEWNSNAGGGGGGDSTNPLDFAKDLQRDIRMFPEYFNSVTYFVFAALMAYLLYLTSNSRGRSWFFRHFTLSNENFSCGRIYTLLTYPFMEVSFLSLAVNLLCIRWGGNMILNLGGGEKGMLRSFGMLTVGPGIVYMLMSTASREFGKSSYLELGGATLPSSHFQVREESVCGANAVSAGLLANGILEITARAPTSRIIGVSPTLALPMLTTTYFILATSGSTESWLSLTGVSIAYAHRMFLKRGF